MNTLIRLRAEKVHIVLLPLLTQNFLIMKKLQLLFVSLLAVSMTFAQQEKGDIYLGGSLNFGAGSSSTKVGGTKTDGPSTFNLGIQPRVGYFLSEKILVGADLGFTTGSSKIDNGGTVTKVSNNAFGGGLFARYYVMPAEKLGFFFEANAGVLAGSSKVKVGNTETDGPNTFNLSTGITPGIVIFISKKVALEANYGFLGYTSFSETDKSGSVEVKDAQGNFGLSLNPNTFRFGVSVLF